MLPTAHRRTHLVLRAPQEVPLQKGVQLRDDMVASLLLLEEADGVTRVGADLRVSGDCVADLPSRLPPPLALPLACW